MSQSPAWLGLWWEDAACGRADPHLFDPPIGATVTTGEAGRYKSTADLYCAGCPVAAACSADADAHGDSGLRGGSLRWLDKQSGNAYVALRLTPRAPESAYDRYAVQSRQKAARQRDNQRRQLRGLARSR